MSTRPSILIGWYEDNGRRRRVEIEPELRDENGKLTLAISATAGRARKSDGGFILDAYDEPRDYSGGQCIDEAEAVTQFAAGWSAERRDRLVDIWRTWHLNHMNAGCEHQRAEQWDKRPIDPSKPTDAYGLHFEGQRSASWNMLTWIPPTDHPDGLLGVPCPTCGYRFGTAWLYEELPADVVAFMRQVIG